MDSPEVKADISNLRDALKSSQRDSDGEDETQDIEFLYDDSDTYSHEIAELYSYTEEPDFHENKTCFEECLGDEGSTWQTLDERVQREVVMRQLDKLELSHRPARLAAARALLYLLQGTWGECETVEEQESAARDNVFLLYSCGILPVFTDLLALEIDNTVALSEAMKKPAISIVDSEHLRVILSVVYTVVETARHERPGDTEEQQVLRQQIRAELGEPGEGQEPLAVTLLNMVTQFCSGHAPHFPMKKVLLLLWKVLLLTLGGLSDWHARRNEARETVNLPVVDEDPLEVTRQMRASSPPALAAELLDPSPFSRARPRPPHRKPRDLTRQPAQALMKQSGVVEGDAFPGGGEGGREEGGGAEQEEDEGLPPTPPRPATPVRREVRKPLPWKPKVRQKELEQFLETTRLKFVGLEVRGNTTSLAGLPPSIKESVRILKEHLYVSLAEVQVDREEDMAKNPLSKPETEVPENAVEVLYRAMLPNLPQYMIALLKTLLAAAPTSKPKSDSINILADVLPQEMPTTVLQSMKLGVDVNRHQEVIVKAISASLLLLLKHFKLNHVYQFEFMSQHLVFANCIPLVLKFFNHNILSYVSAKNGIPVLDFPYCVVGAQQELTAESLESGDNAAVCWRNLFSCINLLRILSKLTKWKHSRTMMLVVFKSAPILKRALRVRHALLQLYVLKLLKLQTKYLGRQWRKGNMRALSGIYQKVRHRLNDDWAFGNDMDARPWDFQAEECALRSRVDRFNARRYGGGPGGEPEYRAVDNCLTSVLGQEVALTPEFTDNYEAWLDQEVFSNHIDWDQVLNY